MDCDFRNKNITIRKYDFPDTQMAYPFEYVLPFLALGMDNAELSLLFFLRLGKGIQPECKAHVLSDADCSTRVGLLTSESPAFPFNIHTWTNTKDNLCSCCHAAIAAKSFQSCMTRCDPIDGSPPGSSVPGILQARTLEWVAISFSSA